MRPPVGWLIAAALVSGVLAVGLILIALRSWRGRSVRIVFALTVALTGCVAAMAVPSFDCEWMWREALLVAVRAVLLIAVAAAVATTNGRILYLVGL